MLRSTFENLKNHKNLNKKHHNKKLKNFRKKYEIRDTHEGK